MSEVSTKIQDQISVEEIRDYLKTIDILVIKDGLLRRWYNEKYDCLYLNDGDEDEEEGAATRAYNTSYLWTYTTFGLIDAAEVCRIDMKVKSSPQFLKPSLAELFAAIKESKIDTSLFNGAYVDSSVEAVTEDHTTYTVSLVLVKIKRVEGSLKFDYRNYRGELSTREVFPLKIEYKATEWHPWKQWLLTAYDPEKRSLRDFAVNDMVGCHRFHLSPTGRQIQPPELQDMSSTDKTVDEPAMTVDYTETEKRLGTHSRAFFGFGDDRATRLALATVMLTKGNIDQQIEALKYFNEVRIKVKFTIET